MGLGKKRSKYGEFIDANGITQEEIRRETRLGKNTITRACAGNGDELNGSTKRTLVEAARRLSGKNVSEADFWGI